jgi:uncharacterized Zn-binding protein involved in type VI secretion
MPAVSGQGDRVMSKDGSGKKCKSPMRTSVGQVNSKNVYVNGKLIVVAGNTISPHPKRGCTPDTSTLSSYSSSVRIGGLGIGRIGDEYGPNIITQGSRDVFAGG